MEFYDKFKKSLSYCNPKFIPYYEKVINSVENLEIEKENNKFYVKNLGSKFDKQNIPLELLFFTNDKIYKYKLTEDNGMELHIYFYKYIKDLILLDGDNNFILQIIFNHDEHISLNSTADVESSSYQQTYKQKIQDIIKLCTN